MAFRHRLALAIATAAGLFLAGAASAERYVDTIWGSASWSGYGLFNGGGPFELQYVYDSASPARIVVPGVSDTIYDVQSVTLTMNGQTHQLPGFGVFFNTIQASPGNLNAQYFAAVSDADPVWIETINISVDSPLLPATLSPNNIGPMQATGSGSYALQLCCCFDCGPDFVGYWVTGDLTVGAFAISAPEPATWAMLMLGLAIMGTVLRLRRSPDPGLVPSGESGG